MDFLSVSISGRLWTINWDDDVNRLLADDEVGASQESGGGFNSEPYLGRPLDLQSQPQNFEHFWECLKAM